MRIVAKAFRLFGLAFVSLLSACTASTSVVVMKVEVLEHAYRVSTDRLETSESLVAALKAVPNLEAIYLAPDQGISQARINATIDAMRKAGIQVPIGMVGNEAFIK